MKNVIINLIKMFEMECYGKFITLSENATENIRNMSDFELNVLSQIISNALLENQIEIMDKLKESLQTDK